MLYRNCSADVFSLSELWKDGCSVDTVKINDDIWTETRQSHVHVVRECKFVINNVHSILIHSTRSYYSYTTHKLTVRAKTKQKVLHFQKKFKITGLMLYSAVGGCRGVIYLVAKILWVVCFWSVLCWLLGCCYSTVWGFQCVAMLLLRCFVFSWMVAHWYFTEDEVYRIPSYKKHIQYRSFDKVRLIYCLIYYLFWVLN